MYTIEDLDELICELAHKKVKHDYDLIQARPHFSGNDSRYVMYKNYKTREYTRQAQDCFDIECSRYRRILEKHLQYK